MPSGLLLSKEIPTNHHNRIMMILTMSQTTCFSEGLIRVSSRTGADHNDKKSLMATFCRTGAGTSHHHDPNDNNKSGCSRAKNESCLLLISYNKIRSFRQQQLAGFSSSRVGQWRL